MVQITLPAFAFLIISPLVAASTAPVSRAVVPFSLEKWIEAIIADPQGDHLSPEDAAEAYMMSLNATQAGGSPFGKRQTSCFLPQGQKRAYIPDAVACINNLAAKGDQACVATPSATRFCTIRNGAITGVSGLNKNTQSRCQDVARGAGKVMDRCTTEGNSQDTNSVYGQNPAWGNGNMAVHVHGP